MAIVASSGAIMLDGMFNFVSGIMSYFFIGITRLVSGNATRDYPLGYFAFESLFVFIKGAIILLLIVMAVYSNLKVLFSGGREPSLGLMSLYVVAAVVGCLVLYMISRAAFKKTGSEILETETSGWLINAIISSCIGVALGITMLLRGTALGWIDRYIDQILVIFMSLVFIRDPLVFMKNGLKQLLLASPQKEYITPYEDRILPLKEQLDAREMSLEVLKTGRRMWVTVWLTPEKNTISMDEIRHIKETIRKTAWEIYENTQTEVILEAG
jgi:predicted Co/Zn/Cd cation transporter (cation efflux family)